MISPPYHPSPQIRHVRVGDRVVILDFRSECYLALNPTASQMWEELTQPSDPPVGLDHLKRHSLRDRAELLGELHAFVQQCLEQGLLEPGEYPVPDVLPLPRKQPFRRGGLVLRAWLALLRVSQLLSRRGLTFAYARAVKHTAFLTVASPDQPALLDRCLRAFSRAENLFWLRRAPLDCLPRSLALFAFLRSMGLPACHYIGIRPFPFSAHAWTECGGRILHDDLARREALTKIAQIPE